MTDQPNPYVVKVNNARELTRLRMDEVKKYSESVIASRLGYWEKIALFDAGLTALSINFAATLHSHQQIRVFPLLGAAWVFLAFSMAMAFLRNRFHTDYTFFSVQGQYHDARAQKAAAEKELALSGIQIRYSDSTDAYDPIHVAQMRHGEKQNAEDNVIALEKREKQMELRSRICEKTASLGTLIGILMLITVAVINLKP